MLKAIYSTILCLVALQWHPIRSQEQCGEARQPALDEFKKSSTSFAASLYSLALKENNNEGNFFFSPYSISMALGLLLVGSEGQTKNEILRAMKLNSNSINDLKALFSQQFNSVNKRSDHYELNTANAGYFNQHFKLKPKYKDTIEQCFDSKVETIDFAQADAATKINDWISGKTNNRIKDLIEPTMLSGQTQMVLVNTIYFLSQWKIAFEKIEEPIPFYDKDFKSTPVAMMQTTLDTRFRTIPQTKSDHDYEMLEIPYKGNELSMLIFIPEKSESRPNLLKRSFDYWIEKEAPPLERMVKKFDEESQIGRAKVTMPQFEMTLDLPLKNILYRMGIEKMFSSGEFGGMTDDVLAVSEALHRAYIKVDEKGTEAAGATAFITFRSAGPPPEPKSFLLDHPFIYLIRHKPTGAILFMGRYAQPQ